jgi:hypothetical protein
MEAAVGMNVHRGVKKSYDVRRRKGAGCSITTGTMYITKEGGHCRQ